MSSENGLSNGGAGVKPRGGSNRVIRGGSWNNNAENCRSANRNNNTPDRRNRNIGFRLLSSAQWPDEIRRIPLLGRVRPGAGRQHQRRGAQHQGFQDALQPPNRLGA